MATNTHEIDAVKFPSFLYGTAWKEDETQRLTELAMQQGFRGIDTANQRKHYFEAGVGQAIAAAMQSGQVARENLFLQTKFTYQAGQDERLPYDPHAPIEVQMEHSFTSSLQHLGVATIDSYLLHAPSQRAGLTQTDLTAWRTMEELHERQLVRFLGISNVTGEQLKLLCQHARVQPTFVQNRCYAIHGWDREVRQFCLANGIVYQGFSLLTANRQLLNHPEMVRLAALYHRTVPQIIFRFAIDIGMLPLTGTTNPQHMQADLEVTQFQLEAAEVALIEKLATS
jgi:diketogulonate reductase-like aldo/keto reductase